jgi:DnaJ-class molecular chaperone
MGNPCEQIGLPALAGPAEVKAWYIEQARALHPDAGGDPAAFATMAEKYKLALAFASAPRTCAACGGKGRVPKQAGFITNWPKCEPCDGQGKVKPQ